MVALKTKLEIIENIATSDNVIGSEKVCILASSLSEDIKKEILMFVNGMVRMAEIMSNEKREP